MQQYRVNYPLLIGLVIGTAVCSAAVFGVWKFQIERKSGWLISKAESSLQEGNLREAAQFYGQYLSIHPENEEIRYKLANVMLDQTEKEDATADDLGNAVRSLEAILRNREGGDSPAAKEVRRRLVSLYGRDSIRNWGSALGHLDILLQDDPNNAELQSLRASYLARNGSFDDAAKISYKLIGYDPKTDKFDVKAAVAPQQVKVYPTLAGIIRGQMKNPELAERTIDQMVEANPKSAAAYVERGRMRSLWNNSDGSRADAEKAFQLDPDDLEVLLFNADMASRDEHYDKAHEFIEKAKKLHPQEARVYQAAAMLQLKEKSYDKALAEIEQGIKNLGDSKSMELQFFKAELQIQKPDVKGARQTIEDLKQRRNLRPEIFDYFDARLLLAENKWFEASEAFNKLRSRISDFGAQRVMEVDFSLGLCYERLGRPDMARDQYELVLQQDPQNEPALSGIQRVDAQRGIELKPERGGDDWAQQMADFFKKPKEQRDIAKLIASLRQMADKRKLDPVAVKLMEAQIYLMAEDFDAATKTLADANKMSPDNLQVMRAAVALARVNPKLGPKVAMDRLNKVVAKFGDEPSLRIEKADILIQLNKDQEDKEPLKRDLAGLMAGIDKWTDAQKVELWRNMAGRYLSLNMPDEARQSLALAADKLPSELPLRVALFDLALQAGDDKGMQEAQDKILEVVKDKNDSNWLYSEARRQLQAVRRGRASMDTLPAIRKLAEQAQQQRPEWSELLALMGEIEMMANNLPLALQHYDKAEEVGRPAPGIVAQHIRLLSMYGRFKDAGKLLDRIPEQARQQLLGPLYAEILFRSEQTDTALKEALAATKADPNNAQYQYSYGQLLARAAEDPKLKQDRKDQLMGDAIKAMQRATELQPDNPDAWFALIYFFAKQKDENQAQKTMRDAQLALSGDSLTLFLARSYEVLHRWFDAETMYREIYETDPSDIGRAQQLAAFYVGPLYQRPDKEAKATPLINQILQAGADKKIPANDGSLLWARRTAAKMLATTGDYQNVVKADKLLRSNSQEGNLLLEDKLALAEILAKRPEPDSRMKAIALLEEADRIQPLNEMAQVQLGELYLGVGMPWTTYRSHMDKVIATYPTSIKARELYARRLLAHGDQRSLDAAATQLAKIRELQPNYPPAFELTVRLGGKLGKQKEVRTQLLSRIPKMPDGELPPDQLQQFGFYAGLLTDLGDLDSAEKIYQQVAARNPAANIDLARFLGEHRDADRCFAKLAEVYRPALVQDVLNVAISVARAHRDKIGDKYDAQIQQWLDAGLRENPDSIQLLIAQGDMYDLQKKYDDAAGVYRKLLGRPDVTGVRRAIVLNNLSFLEALSASAAKGDDPLAMAEEAAQIMGPNSEILDTRAVVLTAQGKYKDAIHDLELAVTDNATASKYYHLAVAHFKANEPREAVEAWEKAEGMGLSKESLNRMEFDQYDDMKTKIDQIRKKSVTQAEPARKAG